MCFCFCRLNHVVFLGRAKPWPNFRNYAELYWDFNESIPRPLGGQEVPANVFISTPKI